jgi:hypothetical protein
MEKKGNH